MTRRHWWRGLLAQTRLFRTERRFEPRLFRTNRQLVLRVCPLPGVFRLSRLAPSWRKKCVAQPQYTGYNMPNPLDSLWATVILGIIATFALYHFAAWLMGG